MEPLNHDFLAVDPLDPKYQSVTHMSVYLIIFMLAKLIVFVYKSVGPFMQRLRYRKPAGSSY